MPNPIQTKVGAWNGNAATAETSFASLPAAGDSVFAWVRVYLGGTSGSVSGVADNQVGNTYVKIKAIKDANTNGDLELWWCSSITAPSGTFTVTASLPSAFNARVDLIEGVAGLTLDQSNTATNSTTATTATITNAAANSTADDFVMAGIEVSYTAGSLVSNPATTGYTSFVSDPGFTNYVDTNIGYKTETTQDTSSATWTSWTTAQYWAAIIASFKPASSGSTGSAAIIEPPDVVSASSGLSTSGSAAITESPDVVSGAGTAGSAITGSAVIQEALDVTFGVGSVAPGPQTWRRFRGPGVSADWQQTFVGRTLSTHLSPSASGGGSIAEAPDTISGTGVLSTAGAAAIAEAADIASGAGTPSTSGEAAIAEPSDVVSGAGVAGAAGSGAAVEGADVVAGTGGLSAAGSAAIAEGADTVVGSGALATSGTAAMTEAHDIVSGAGIAGNAGAGAVSEGHDVVSGYGAASPPLIYVPDVVGWFYGNAYLELVELGLAVNAPQKSSPGGMYGPGVVLYQSPAAGSKVATGTAITLAVNGGSSSWPT